MKIFVGNLAADVSEDDLREAGAAFGEVTEVSVAVDDKGAPKGFGFVEMGSKAEGQAALAGLNGKEIKGQAVKVSEARPEKRSGKSGQAWTGLGGPGAQGLKGGSSKGSSKTSFKAPKSIGHNKV